MKRNSKKPEVESELERLIDFMSTDTDNKLKCLSIDLGERTTRISIDYKKDCYFFFFPATSLEIRSLALDQLRIISKMKFIFK